MEWKDWINKGVFLRTIRGKIYSGKITNATNRFIEMNDKFSKKVTISISEIAEIKEEN
jgi:hypothetical protein